MDQNSRGSYNASISTRKRPFATTDGASQQRLVDLNTLQPAAVAAAAAATSNGNSRSPTGSKRKRHQPPPPPPPLPAAQSAHLNHNAAISTSSVYINLPHKMPSQRSVPAFLHKLYNMVGDPSTDPYIRWSVDGNSFLVQGHEEFARLILPRFYKHNTFASFVRQLNMYDFHKVPHLQQGVMLSSTKNPNVEVWEFSSPNFQKNRPDLLILVTRKRNRDRQEANADPVNLGALVREISCIKKHQTTITADLRNLHRDNEIIWQETLVSREKHQKHQQIIAKILQFLTAVFSNDHHHQLLVSSGNNNNNNNNNDATTTALVVNTAVAKPPDNNNNNQQQQPTQAHQNINHNMNMKDLSKSISKCNVSARERSSDSALGSSDSGAASSDSGNSSGAGSGSDGDDDTTTTANLPQAWAAPDNICKTNHASQDLKTDFCSPIVDMASVQVPAGFVHVASQPTASRSAQAITDDIDQLQENIEMLAVQLGIDPAQFGNESLDDFGFFSETYSDMISSASKTDKRRLFDLADGKKKMRQKQHSPQPTRPQDRTKATDPNDTLYSQYMPYPGQNPFLQNSTSYSAGHNDFSTYFCHLLKSVDTNNNHNLEGQAATRPKVEFQQTDLNASTTDAHPAAGSIPLCNNNTSSELYHTYYNSGNSLVYSSNNNVVQPYNSSAQLYNGQSTVSSYSSNLYAHQERQHQQHTGNSNLKTAAKSSSTMANEEAPSYYASPAPIIPPPPSSQSESSMYKQSLHQTTHFSYLKPPHVHSNVYSPHNQQLQQQQKVLVCPATVAGNNNATETLPINAPLHIANQSNHTSIRRNKISFMMTLGDIISQQAIEKKGFDNHDVGRSVRIMIYAAAINGPLVGTWFGFINNAVKIKNKWADQAVFSPAILAIFMGGISILEGNSYLSHMNQKSLQSLKLTTNSTTNNNKQQTSTMSSTATLSSSSSSA
ncbi:hypothetical protein [Parasitella parasitica]|uniref:HSF-type DNA-binding domain-containing protein n=1 Tax=Parasitella parasitica TaxID=35722 RepID=A0A0B7NA48_9FUNG|nr:hypothetical protein [Parasitella parasitica]